MCRRLALVKDHTACKKKAKGLGLVLLARPKRMRLAQIEVELVAIDATGAKILEASADL